eukprot:2620312-Amphidinium_carterae.5
MAASSCRALSSCPAIAGVVPVSCSGAGATAACSTPCAWRPGLGRHWGGLSGEHDRVAPGWVHDAASIHEVSSIF